MIEEPYIVDLRVLYPGARRNIGDNLLRAKVALDDLRSINQPKSPARRHEIETYFSYHLSKFICNALVIPLAFVSGYVVLNLPKGLATIAASVGLALIFSTICFVLTLLLRKPLSKLILQAVASPN